MSTFPEKLAMQRNNKMWPYSRKKADNRNGFSVGPVLRFSKIFRAPFINMFKELQEKKWQQKIGDFSNEKPNGNSKIEK